MAVLYLFPSTSINPDSFFSTLTNVYLPTFAKHQHFFAVFSNLWYAWYVVNYSLHILCDLSGTYNSFLCASSLHFPRSIKWAVNLAKMRNSLV